MNERPGIPARYDLAPHPEGGWYRRVWTAGEQVRLADGRVRPTATMIQFCLLPGECSAWHLVASDEVWVWNGAGPVTLELGGRGERPAAGARIVLGLGDGEALQAVVAAGTWQRTLPGETTALVSCVVSPGFDFADFRLAEDGSPR